MSTWDDSAASRARLGDLETAVLNGSATPAELDEYRDLADAHDAWVRSTPQYLAFCEEWAVKLGADVAQFTALAGAGKDKP